MWILNRKESLDSQEVIYLEIHRVIMVSIYGFSSICSNLNCLMNSIIILFLNQIIIFFMFVLVVLLY
jgi:hypothetical protein